MALGNSEKIGVAYVEVRASTAKLKTDLNAMQKQTETTTRKIAAGFAKVTGAIFAARAAWNFAKEAKNAARDAQETRSKFNTVFESIRAEANKTADTFASAFGIAGTTARKLLGDTGDLLVGFGFTEKAALEMSKEVNSLAQDLASFTNFSGGAEGASAALTKAILGEAESAKSLGIVIRQNTKEFRAEIKQIMDSTGATQQQAKAQVILAQAYSQSQKAIGDYARTSEGAANLERRLDEQYKETIESIGEGLMPAYRGLLGTLSSLLKLVTPIVSAVRDEGREVNKLSRELLNSETPQERRLEIYEELKKIAPEVVENINAEALATETLTTNLKNYNTELIKRLVIEKRESVLADTLAKQQSANADLNEIQGEIVDNLTDRHIRLQSTLGKAKTPKAITAATKALEDFEKILFASITLEEKLIELTRKSGEGEAFIQLGDLRSAKKEFTEITKEVDELTKSLTTESDAADDNVVKTEKTTVATATLTKQLEELGKRKDILTDQGSKLSESQKVELTNLNDQTAAIERQIEARKNLSSEIGAGDIPELSIEASVTTLDQDITKDLEAVEGVEKLEIAVDETSTSMEILGDVSSVALGGMASMLSREVELFKDANTFAEKLLNNIVQLGLQAATLRLIGGFATGGIGGSGLLGFIGSSLGFASGGNATASPNGITRMADGGGFTVPNGFSNDSFPMLLKSGEDVEVKNQSQQLKSDRVLQSVRQALESLNKSIVSKDGKITIINTQDVTSRVMKDNVEQQDLSKAGVNFEL